VRPGDRRSGAPGPRRSARAGRCAAVSIGLADAWRRSGRAAPSSPSAVLMLLIGAAWLGEASGLTSLLGALWGGVLLNRLSPTPPVLGGWLSLLSEVFLPLYFISVGMRLQAGSLLQGQAWGLALTLLLLAFASKLLCGLGISVADRHAGIDRWLVIAGLMPRGLPGLVFATTALTAGVITPPQFSALVLMVTLTTVVGLLLLERRLQQKAPGGEAEGNG
ncbi:MAG: cation:proton antiporter, partial [Cyanobium sp.]